MHFLAKDTIIYCSFFSEMNPSVADILNSGVNPSSNATSGGGEGNSNLQLEQLVLEQGGEREAVWSPNFSIAHLIEFTKLETLRLASVIFFNPFVVQWNCT